MGMPAPAVYIPERTLPPGTSAKWGFEPVGGTFHHARHRDLTLAADINSSDTIDLLIVPASLFGRGAKDVACTHDPQVLAVGHFSDPHPREWKNAAYAAAKRGGGFPGLLVVVGPDDYPGIGTREQYKDVSQAVANLWIFKSKIAAVFVVGPHPEISSGPEIARLPFEVADEVVQLTGIDELRTLARMADAGPFECFICQGEETASKATTVAVVLNISGRPAGQERAFLNLAHRSCTRSQVVTVGRDEMTLKSETTVLTSTALISGRGGRPRPLLIISFQTSITAGPGGPDILVSNLLSDGMTVVRKLRQTVPRVSRFSATIRHETVSVWDPHGGKLIAESEVSMPAWREAVKDQGEVTVLLGSALGLESGQESGIIDVDRIIEVARLGRLVGGRVQVWVQD
jgi:hypothetical protein